MCAVDVESKLERQLGMGKKWMGAGQSAIQRLTGIGTSLAVQ